MNNINHGITKKKKIINRFCHGTWLASESVLVVLTNVGCLNLNSGFLLTSCVTLGKVFIILKLVIYEFWAVLCLCGCAWAFSSCGEQRLLSSCRALVSYCGGFSCCKAWALECGLL